MNKVLIYLSLPFVFVGMALVLVGFVFCIPCVYFNLRGMK